MSDSRIQISHDKTTLKTGSEKFRAAGQPLGFDLLSFWRWSASDLVSNSLRGLIAEYIVAVDLGVADRPRIEWNAYDFVTKRGTRVEVKSASYLQSWPQKELSKIRFGIAPKQGWDAATNEWWPEKRRNSNAYVFCLLAHKDPRTVDPLDLDQWRFFVLSTRTLDDKVQGQQSLGLRRLKELGAIPAAFGTIGETVDRLAQATQIDR
jgi:hypothetical protein